MLFSNPFKTIGGTEMAEVEKKKQKMIPFITCEFSLCQYVCELVFGVDVFDVDLGVQIDSIKQPIKSNSVASGNMSQCLASSLYDHLDHCFVVLKDIQQSFPTIRNLHCPNHHSMSFLDRLKFVRCCTIRVSVKNCDEQIP